MFFYTEPKQVTKLDIGDIIIIHGQARYLRRPIPATTGQRVWEYIRYDATSAVGSEMTLRADITVPVLCAWTYAGDSRVSIALSLPADFSPRPWASLLWVQQGHATRCKRCVRHADNSYTLCADAPKYDTVTRTMTDAS